MAKKTRTKALGIVPRTLLRGAIVGAIPACALTGCTSERLFFGADGSAQDRSPDRPADRQFFSVDAPAFIDPDGGIDGRPDFKG